ncbi:uncharacterized protein LOC107037735 [Diachasma alloeum]|uniref:uncharacterized protein LOC107037735 n=1 Tax=Diachasma alloeum TaxID=454923 RepID=UPI00073812A4|nr:uncharacterized protein LOC107037735 [Diachasma alloeum]XP_015111931.1 uncharacterized protein LOC107037735 [Diachasma alloeum]XP_015111932.1 uncharacterized protein LOC107037735 [Diachasma alloeum]
MSSDSEDLSRPSKKRRYIIDDSESSDDSVVTKSNRKRRVFKVVSDVDSSDDDSDVPRPVRRKNATTKIIVSEDESSSESDDAGSLQLESDEAWESDWLSTDSSDVDEVLPKKSRVKPKTLDPSPSSLPPKQSGSDSEQSDGQTEKCPICLLPFKKQQVATPATCDHCFCLLCLTEWSKNVNTCPVDRQPFTSINVRFHLNGKIVQKIPVESKNSTEEHIQEDPTFCEVCQECDREDRMLLCDGCDLGFHLECLNPPMDRVPMEEWYCPTCTEINPSLAESIEMDLDELPDLMAEARCLGTTYGRTRSGAPQDFPHPPMHTPGPSHRRIIPRTRQTERVRANIRADRRRQENTRHFDPDQPSTSSGIESVYDSNSRNDLIASVIQRVSAAMSRNARGRVKSKSAKKPRRRKTARKTSSRSTGNSEVREVRIREINEDGEEKEIVTYVKVKTSSTKRKTKRTKRTRKKLKRKTTKRHALSSLYGKGVKKRLAITLGMVKGRAKVPSVAEPVVNNQGTVRSGVVELTNSRFRAGISQVSLFGNNLGLDYSPPGSDDETMLDSPGLTLGSIVGIQRRNVSISSTRRRLALKGMLLEPRSSPPTDQQLQSPMDLLDSIMGSQKLWHSKSNKITLKANGTLLLPSDLDKKSDKDENDNNSSNKDLTKRLVDNSDTIIDKKIGQPLDLSSISSEDITQAPMYNGSRGGGGPRGGGGGGGGRGHNYHGGRDSYSNYSGGRQNYNARGTGMSPRGGFGHRERGQSPGMTDFPPNFDNRMNHNFNSSFRFRNSPNFRNDNRPRMPMMPNMPRPPNHMFRGPSDNMNPIFPITQSIYPPPLLSQPPPPPPAECPVPNAPHKDYSGDMEQEKSDVPVESSSSALPSPSLSANKIDKIDDAAGVDAVGSSVIEGGAEAQGNEEDCDIYADIESRDDNRKNLRNNESSECENREGNEEGTNSGDCTSSILLPPPEPPSELLLDLEENLKNDSYETNSRGSDNEDLVIDDSHKEPEREVKEIEKDEKTETSAPKYYDKYDPFQEADSDEESQADCPNFSIYSSETMDVARRAEEQLSQEIDIGPLEPPPLPPDIPDDDQEDLSPFQVHDDPEEPREAPREEAPREEAPVERVDTPDIPEPPPTFDPYVESLRKERQQLSKIPSKKISTDCRGKITFKIGNKSKVMNKLSSLYDEIDDNIETMIEQERELEASVVEPQSSVSEDPPSEDISSAPKKLDEPVEKEPEEQLPSPEPQPDKPEEKAPDEGDEEEVEGEVDKKISDKSDDEDLETSQPVDKDEDPEKLNDSMSTEGSDRGGTPPLVNEAKSNSDNCRVSESSDVINEDESILSQDFQLEKDENPSKESEIEKSEEDKNLSNEVKSSVDDNMEGWYSDGAYTPCKDENPVAEKGPTKSQLESGLEPITPPPKDRNSDDLDRCRTPIGYAGLGTEAISENDEPISFEDDRSAALSPSMRKDKELEDGEITMDEGRPPKKKRMAFDSDKEGEREGKKRKDRRDKSGSNKDADKNKENTSDNNQVSWKKLSKSTKERQYREKLKRHSASKERHRERNRNRDRDRERDRDYEKEKDKPGKKRKSRDRAAALSAKNLARKKEKRKELPRYDVRKIVAEKPARPKKDEYGRDVRTASSRSRSRGRSLARGKSHSYSPARRSWPRRLSRSWSNHRRRSLSRASRASSRYSRSRSRSRSARRSRSRSHSRSRSRSHTRSRSRRKSPVARRRSLSRKRSRSASPRRGRRSLSNQRARKNHSKRVPTRKRKSRSRSRKKEKVKKYKSRSRSRRRKRTWSKSPQPVVRREKGKKRLKRKIMVGKSRSRERSLSRNWESMNMPRSLDRGYPMRSSAITGPLTLLSGGMLETDQMNHTTGQNQSTWSGAQWTPSWSRSKTKSRSRSRSRSNGPGLEPVPPKNLTVILTNKEAIKKKRRERRLKEGRKRRDDPDRVKKRDKRNRTPPPSKEVFASGDNILVSVCFNNDNMSDNNDKAPMSVPNGDSISSQLADTIASLTSKKRKRRNYREVGMAPMGVLSKEPLSKKPKKDKSKDKRGKSPEPKRRREKKKKSKAAEIAASKKPVAVIDLDQSPFREQTPSPKDIIVLSDDDDDDNDSTQQLQQQLQQLQNAISPAILHQQQQKSSDSRHDEQTQQQEIQNDNLASQRDEFVGPKTPPEPQVKFSINKQSNNMRPSMMNPLLDEEEDDEDGDNEDADDDGDDDDDNTNVQHQKISDDKDRNNANKSGKNDAKLINDLAAELLNSNDPSRENEHTGASDGDIIIVADSNEEELDDLEALEILEMNERTHGLSQQTDNGNQGEMDSMKHDRSEERRNQDELDMRLKIGPNTPPEPPTSPPTSPDAYDPFDPTKSRSPTPTASQETSIGIDSALTSNDSMKLSVSQGKENFSSEKRETADKPKIISMVTIKRASSPSAAGNIINLEKSEDGKAKANSGISTSIGNPFTTINPVLATVAAAVQRIGIQRNLSNAQIKQRTSGATNQVSNLFMNSVKGMTLRGSKVNTGSSKQNGNEGTEGADAVAAGPTIDTSSPYSPGSSLSDGFFDPPPHQYGHVSSPPGNLGIGKGKGKTGGKTDSKKDAFDALFGASPLIKSGKGRGKKTMDKRKRTTNSKIGVRMDENELQILDDLPSSAVEMQVKDKFLKKLNRQERVVEEVKLVLKPHYTKKHVTKEEYKDIMRKAVPKICHNKTGEINPKKIAQLVEAYVRKCRSNKRKGTNVNPLGNSMAKNLRPTKTLWS